MACKRWMQTEVERIISAYAADGAQAVAQALIRAVEAVRDPIRTMQRSSRCGHSGRGWCSFLTGFDPDHSARLVLARIDRPSTRGGGNTMDDHFWPKSLSWLIIGALIGLPTDRFGRRARRVGWTWWGLRGVSNTASVLALDPGARFAD